MHYPEAPSISVIYGYINVVLPKDRKSENDGLAPKRLDFPVLRNPLVGRRAKSQVLYAIWRSNVQESLPSARKQYYPSNSPYVLLVTITKNPDTRHHTRHVSIEVLRMIVECSQLRLTLTHIVGQVASRLAGHYVLSRNYARLGSLKNLVRRSGSDVPGVTNLGRSCCPVAQEMISTYCMSPQQFVFGDSFLVPKDFSTADVTYTRTYQSGSPLSC